MLPLSCGARLPCHHTRRRPLPWGWGSLVDGQHKGEEVEGELEHLAPLAGRHLAEDLGDVSQVAAPQVLRQVAQGQGGGAGAWPAAAAGNPRWHPEAGNPRAGRLAAPARGTAAQRPLLAAASGAATAARKRGGGEAAHGRAVAAATANRRVLPLLAHLPHVIGQQQQVDAAVQPVARQQHEDRQRCLAQVLRQLLGAGRQGGWGSGGVDGQAEVGGAAASQAGRPGCREALLPRSSAARRPGCSICWAGLPGGQLHAPLPACHGTTRFPPPPTQELTTTELMLREASWGLMKSHSRSLSWISWYMQQPSSADWRRGEQGRRHVVAGEAAVQAGAAGASSECAKAAQLAQEWRPTKHGIRQASLCNSRCGSGWRRTGGGSSGSAARPAGRRKRRCAPTH